MKNIGKYIYALPILISGIFHLLKGPDMAGMVPSYIPFPVVWVYVTGVALIAAAVSIYINKKTKLAATLLAVLIGIFIVLVHFPGASAGNQMSIGMLLKDLGLLGGALVIAGISKDNT
ncbi:DoxX family protein [Leptospira semungkisensis]|uniref:DoxX family protein n=1 Tax=Leptospira semungkisensis TaxID=2484985 RepID=A0A4R9G989_9LEPT|nr:DoxX family protein [Leptospira semungkisensis]TGK07620.1 DoxX family protein [Leptospira semungkisensis]